MDSTKLWRALRGLLYRVTDWIRRAPKGPWINWIGLAGAILIVAGGLRIWSYWCARLEWRGRLPEIVHALDAGLPNRARELLEAARSDPDSVWLVRVPEWTAMHDVLDAFDAWDTIDKDNLARLERRLRDGYKAPGTADAILLLRYRLARSPDPTGYFQRDTLVSPYARMLAARESHYANPRWAGDLLLRTAQAAADSNSLVLAAASNYWAAKAKMTEEHFAEAEQILTTANAQLHASRELDGSTREIDIHAARLECYCHLKRESEASLERSLVQALSQEATRWHLEPVLAKAEFALAREAVSSGQYAVAETLFQSVIRGTDRARRNAYPYMYYVSELSWARVALQSPSDHASGDDIARALVRAADGLRGLSQSGGGPFYSEEAACYYCLALHAHGTAQKAMLESIADSIFEQMPLTKWDNSDSLRQKDWKEARNCDPSPGYACIPKQLQPFLTKPGRDGTRAGQAAPLLPHGHPATRPSAGAGRGDQGQSAKE